MSTVDFGFGWDPTQQVGETKEVTPSTTTLVVEAVDDKIAFLQMQQAIVGNQPEVLQNLISSVSLKIGQKRTLCRLTLKHFSAPVAAALQDFPWSEVIKDENILSAIKKDQFDAFTFMLPYLNTYHFKHVYIHLMDVNNSNYKLYDKYRPAVFARLTPAHQDEVTERFAAQLRTLKSPKVEAHYNLAASLAHMDWKTVFTNIALHRYTSISDTWGWGWMIKEFPTVAQQYKELTAVQTQMVKDVTALLDAIVLAPPAGDDLLSIILAEKYGTNAQYCFTADFLQLCKENSIEEYRVMRTIGEQAKLCKTHGVALQDILLTGLKTPFVGSDELGMALSVLYKNTFKTDPPLPFHMLATPMEKILCNNSNPSSVMILLGSSHGRAALREYFKNPLYVRLFAHHIFNEKVDFNKVLKNIDVFTDDTGNTLMHFVAPSLFNQLEKIKPWVVDPRVSWEVKNGCGLSPKDIAYQYYGSFNQSMIDDAENMFTQRAANILNAQLKKQLLGKSSTSSKRKI